MAPRNSPKATRTRKIHPADHNRAEIEHRTALGQSLEAICAALRSKGIHITRTTLSRRRAEWGLKQRGTTDTISGNANGNITGAGAGADAGSPNKVTKTRPPKQRGDGAGAGARRAEIEARTRDGQSAEEIAEALQAQGWQLNRGASTVQRLQTFWGLIDADEAKARNERRKSANTAANGTNGDRVKKVRTPKEPKVSKREMEREANREQQNSTMHYPTNCSFGPKKRSNAASLVDLPGMPIDPAMADGSLMDDSPYSPDDAAMEFLGETYDVAAEVMSVEILVDLASSTFSATQNLKDMLLAYQGQHPVRDSITGLPPTLQDLMSARKKVREAAGIMVDLAADP